MASQSDATTKSKGDSLSSPPLRPSGASAPKSRTSARHPLGTAAPKTTIQRDATSTSQSRATTMSRAATWAPCLVVSRRQSPYIAQKRATRQFGASAPRTTMRRDATTASQSHATSTRQCRATTKTTAGHSSDTMPPWRRHATVACHHTPMRGSGLATQARTRGAVHKCATPYHRHMRRNAISPTHATPRHHGIAIACHGDEQGGHLGTPPLCLQGTTRRHRPEARDVLLPPLHDHQHCARATARWHSLRATPGVLHATKENQSAMLHAKC